MDELTQEYNALLWPIKPSQSCLSNLDLESSSLKDPATGMDSPVDNTTTSAYGRDYAMINKSHGFKNPPTVSHPSVDVPAIDISVDQNHERLDPDMSNTNIPSPIEENETTGVIRPSTSLDVPVKTPATPGPSSTITQIPNTPTVNEGLDQTSAESVPAAPLRVRESLGLLGLATLAAGHMGIFVVFAFLAYLWFGFGSAPEAANATKVWRQIALSNRTTQAITLASLAIRVLVTLQATACTSIIAALILEKRGARKSYLPWFSAMRGINDGPWRLVQMLLTSRSLAITWYPEFWLALLMIVVTSALQFSSTILLSDLHEFAIIGNYNQTKVPSLMSYDSKTFAIYLTALQYQFRKPVFSTFGEVASTFNSSPNSHGLSDTGLLQRGFLPFSDSQTRTSTRQYNGNTMVMSSRVACMRPNISGSYQYYTDHGNYKGNGLLEGNIQYSSSFREAQINSIPICTADECEEEAFSCSIPSSTFGDWQGAACRLHRFGMGPQSLSLQPKWSASELPWAAESTAFLLTSNNLRDRDWSQVSGNESLPNGQPYREWQSYKILPGRYLNITLCFVGVSFDRKSTSMNSSGNLREPVVNGSVISTEYSTNDVQKLFGVDGSRRNVAERGILDMRIVGEAQDGPATSGAYQTISVIDASNITIAKFTSAVMELVLYAQALQVISSNGTLAFCSYCSIISEGLFDSRLADVLNDILTQSGQAANTLVTYLTVMASSIYYDYLGALATSQEAGTSFTIETLVPGQCSAYGCRGFIAVATLLAVHVLYVGTMAILYIRRVRYSRYGNLWHTTSQLVSGESKETWDESNNTSDAVVIKTFRKERKDDFFKLAQLGGDGQIGFVRENMPETQDPAGAADHNQRNRLLWLKGKLLRNGSKI
ncbi:hypothetical protein FHL15_007907 [Xylaria flabelliformis]|uniref:Uncharacterized protein n=1 Tax=Xylaria flabelliformis TaxID=2512241 RepID=A0A553HT39_9PEZI|nr:hypothetical protein FHL15_007907 [Xylaria flabelliformis]